MTFPPEPTPIEGEITGFFAQNNFERSRRFSAGAYDPGKVQDFLKELGDPQYRYKTIHVAGTVGNGSITTGLARGIQALGYKAGAYLSPHFVSLRERFVINSAPIAAPALAELWSFIRKRPGIEDLSFFDALTALGFLYFAEEKCDWVVVETGLGGRRDSTNNLKAEAAVLTHIGLDHQNILGNSLEEIAFEKAGIIRNTRHVYSPTQQESVATIIANAAKENGADVTWLRDTGADFRERNRNFVLAILQAMFTPSPPVLARIEAACSQPIFGRWSILKEHPRVVFDAGHNAPAMQEIATLLNRQPEAECNIFLNTMRERDLGNFINILRENCGKKINFFLLPI